MSECREICFLPRRIGQGVEEPRRRSLQNFVYDALAGIDADKLAADLLKVGKEKVPDCAFDCHTFFREEQRALKPFSPACSTICRRDEWL